MPNELDMNKLREEAARRAREMQAKARIPPPRKQQKPSAPEEKQESRTFPPRFLKEGETVEEGGFRVTLHRGKREAGSGEKAYFFQSLQEPVQLRPRRTGDVIRLKSGHKSIKKWMIDEKIPAHLREGIPLVCDEEGPVLVCGLSASVVYGAVLWAAAALWGG